MIRTRRSRNQAGREFGKHILHCLWVALTWSATLVLVTTPLEKFFKVGAVLWFMLYMGLGLSYLASRWLKRPLPLLQYSPATFSFIWILTLVLTVPLIKIMAAIIYMSLAPLLHFFHNL